MLLLRFQTAEDRTHFIDRLRREAPELVWQVKASFVQPTVLMVRTSTPQEENRLLSMAAPSVQAFGDTQFKAM